MKFEKEIVIDGKGHLLGRLSSIVAKQLLNGQHVTIVRCEEINQSGPLFRNKLKYLAYLRKRCLVNPSRGAFHFRAPARMFYRVIRGMVPHKTARGAAALERLKVFEGVPPPYDKQKRMVVPSALRVLRLAPNRKFTVLKSLATEMGWKYEGVVDKLEEKRKARSQVFYAKKQALRKVSEQAKKKAGKDFEGVATKLKAFGY